MRGAGNAECRQAVVTADTIFLVDDEIAFGDFGGLGDELVGALAAARRSADAFAEQVLLGDKGEAFADKAAFDTERHKRNGAGGLAADGGPCVLRRCVGHAVFAQQIGQALARAAGPGGEHDAPAFVGPAGGLGFQLVEDVRAAAQAALG